jgi:hypothetical protein
MQELLTMNVQMRIITEANIDQLTNLSFSDNIEKLAGTKTVQLKDLLPQATAAAQREERKKMAALGFTKLPPPAFKKWQIKGIEPVKPSDLTPVPSADSNEFITLEPAQENNWFKLNDEINAAKSKLDEIPSAAYSVIANTLDMYARLRNLVKKNYNMENATNAALKMYELIYQMELLTNGPAYDKEISCLPSVQAFCNAELPGAFIIAINHFMKTKCVSSQFDWIASSYLPAAAMQVGNATILEDKFKIYERNRLHWLMGPAPNGLPDGETPITGDVTDPQVINILGNTAHQRFSENDGATLYTSDVGIEIATEDSNRQEELSAFVNIGQVLTGLLALAVGGHFVTKQFTFVTPFSRSLIAIVASLFEETYITKPKTSRPTNSEVYLVGKWFKGISSELVQALLDRCEAYRTLDKLPTTWGSLLQPEILAQVDGDILMAAQEVHGEQQVAFLNEIYEAFRVSGGDKAKIPVNTFEMQAQRTWLEENPMIVIASDENLNNTKISAEEEAAMFNISGPGAAPEAAEAAEAAKAAEGPAEAAQEQGEEPSLLVPVEEESEGAEAEKEKENEPQGEKRTIKFTL